MAKRAPIRQIILLFVGRLWLPAALFVLFHVLVLIVYMAVEGIKWDDALFWITHPHSIHPERVKTSTKLFATFVFTGVFFFQVWFAERILSAFFAPGGMEAWAMVKNQLGVARMQDHFIVCGYGQVGRTVVDQLRKAQIPSCSSRATKGCTKSCLKKGFL